MRVLWITNILFPEAEQLLTGGGELKSTGGWMLGAADALINFKNVELAIATVSAKVKKLTILEGTNKKYFILPYGKGNLQVNFQYIPLWKQVEKDFKPDVVHIHGTEFSHGYAYMKACSCDNIVISIQGLTSTCYKFYNYGLSFWDIYRNMTIRDLIRGTLIRQQKRFKLRGEFEKEMIRLSKHVIGRTSWDRAKIWAINSDAQYYFCNEILRPEFYDGSCWTYSKCDKHSIFLSQAGYPIKGFHQVLKAMPLILRFYSDAKVIIAGRNLTSRNTLLEKVKYSGYACYIQKLIKAYHLESKVFFTGNLNAEEMKKQYLKSNVFVCPSAIENSPNSLGEAQILGVPCVASYVGGIADMMKGNETNLYRFEEVEMLAQKICNIFSMEEKQFDMRDIAMIRHHSKHNTDTLYNIYKVISKT